MDPGIFEHIPRAAGELWGYNSLVSNGGYAWLAVGSDTYFYAGANCAGLDYSDIGPGVEKRARKLLAKLAPALAKLLPKMHPQSYGWTFAMWTPSSSVSWADLSGTGIDAKFRECEILYGSSDVSLRSFREGFEYAGPDKYVLDIFEGKPLTASAARGIMLSYDAKLAVEIATRIGYPVAHTLSGTT